MHSSLPLLNGYKNVINILFQGAGQDRLGIYIKSVVKGGAADAVSKDKVTLILL